jgi:hypothetical protein
MLRSTVVGTCTLLFLLGLARQAQAQQRPSPCDAVREHSKDTVIVFQPPATFTTCRNGSVESGVVTDRSVYLELFPTPGPRMFDFRVHGKTSDWTPMGLGAWETLTTKIAGKLRDLDHSGEPISNLVIPLEAPPTNLAPLRPLAAARTRYLAEVTPQYLEGLHSVYADARELPVVADVVRRWCASLSAEAPGALAAEAQLRTACAAPEVREGAVEQVLKEFEAAVQKGSAERARAREATLAAIAHPEDPKVVAEGVRALDDARVAAIAVVAAAHALRESTNVLGRAVATLRVSLRSLDALRPGVPTYLATYSTAGNAELEVDAIPSDITAAGTDTHGTNARATARYPIFGRHYLDIEAGLGWAAGVPDSIYLTSTRGVQVIQTEPVQEVVGLALLELEPFRFLWPERPLAGIFRLPVIGIPFTRDPSSNFYFGAALGWTGVGSLSAGPYVIREAMLRQGFSAYKTLPTNVPFDAETYTGAGVGYFVSASIDLVGLFHLFVPSHAPTIDAVTGKEITVTTAAK